MRLIKFVIHSIFVETINALFFGSFGGGGGGCSCPPVSPPPACPQPACPPPPPCGGGLIQPFGPPPPPQFVPQFQPQPPPFQQQSFVLPPQGPVAPPLGNGFPNGYAIQPGQPPVQQNFVPFQQPPPPPIAPVAVPAPSNNENYDYEHFAQKGTDSYINNVPSSQVEVDPSYRNAEQPVDESDPNNVFLPSKVLKKTPSKSSKKIRPPPLDHTFDENFTVTTIAPTTTTVPLTSTTPEDIYDDDKLPDIADYYDNSSNGTNKNQKFDRYMQKNPKGDLLANDYSENSFKSKAAGVKNRIASELNDDNKCGDPFLRRIMTENIVASPTISKQLIFTAGKQHFNKSIDVVCSKNKFSYTVVSSKVFCEVTIKPVTCFAFFQPAVTKKHH